MTDLPQILPIILIVYFLAFILALPFLIRLGLALLSLYMNFFNSVMGDSKTKSNPLKKDEVND